MADSNPITKICTKCNHALALESFYVSRANKDGRTYACKACIAIYYNQNRETLREKSRAWYHNNKARARRCNQQWKDRHRDYLREYERERNRAHPELKRARDRRYDQKHRRNGKSPRQIRYRIRPAGPRLAAAEKQAQKWQAVGTCSVEQLIAKLQYHGWCCLYCKCSLTWRTMHIEHRKPLARGGSHWPANLAPACRRCNLRKSWRTDAEFIKLIASGRLLSAAGN